FTLYGGVIADRVPRRTLIMITQAAMMVLAFAMTGLVVSGLIQAWQIIVLAMLLGVAQSFDAPARQAFVMEMVGREDLTNAIALNSTMFNMAAVVGPALAGIVYALWGPAWCFTINALSYLAVILALAAMRLPAFVPRVRKDRAMTEMRVGLGYVRHNKVVLTLILNMAVIAMFGISLVTLIPAWSVDVLGGDVRTNGALLAARGIGAVSGALMVAALGSRPIRGKLWTVGSFVMPLAMFAFAAARIVPVSMAMLVGVGWSFMVVANTSNSMVQTMVPDELRGRVMGVYTLMFFGGMPLGSLLIGSMAELLTEPVTLAINAAIVLLVAGIVWLRLPFIRKLG
ncbi:MAG: MFS transporter, partial [Anaerolineae bacterium]|nr:MFS transporter [Anaerolineae bacterium]